RLGRGRLAARLQHPPVFLFKLVLIHQAARQQLRIARILHLELAQHLADDDLDVLVVDVHALRAIHFLHFLHDVRLHAVDALDPQNVVGVDGAFRQAVAGLHLRAVPHLEPRAVGDVVDVLLALGVGDDDLALAFGLLDADRARDFRHDGLALGLAGLEQLLHPGQTGGDVLAGHAAGVERAHGQLRARLADGLGRDDAHRFAHFHQLARGQVAPVAAHAHAVPGAASQHRANLDRLHAGLFDLRGLLLVDELVLLNDDGAGLRMHHPLRGHAAGDALPQRLDDLLRVAGQLLDGRHADAVGGAAVLLPHDDVLGHVHQTPRQVARVRGADGRVGQALAGAVGGDEVLQHAQTLAEVGLDGDLDGPARGVGHQAP